MNIDWKKEGGLNDRHRSDVMTSVATQRLVRRTLALYAVLLGLGLILTAVLAATS